MSQFAEFAASSVNLPKQSFAILLAEILFRIRSFFSLKIEARYPRHVAAAPFQLTLCVSRAITLVAECLSPPSDDLRPSRLP